MGKRRITLVVDDDLRLAKGNRWPYDNLLRADSDYGVTVESVEDLPEPNRVQEFRVRVETTSDQNPVTAREVDNWIAWRALAWRARGTVSVTEVEPL